ncbi:MAG: D-alanine--D-alanine ligase [Firmicutes bacterium]|nr:D-alanine--D-alanine ligase [Bacillota bacterium]
MEKIKVAVLFGGRSVEHEVSIISGLQALKALPDKYEGFPVYISKEGVWYCGDALREIKNYRKPAELYAACQKVEFSVNHGAGLLFAKDAPQSGGLFAKKVAPFSCKVDVVLPVFHGSHGEDGCIQGLCELAGLPYAGPGVLGAALGMDKVAMKAILKENDIPVVDYLHFGSTAWQDDNDKWLDAAEARFGYPMIVKPANLGSSIGVGKADTREALRDAIDLAAGFSSRIIVEKCITPLREINCAVLGDADGVQLSLLEEPLNAAEILSFSDKYLSQGASKGMQSLKRRIPAEVDAATEATVRDLAARTFAAMDGSGVCRIDFLLDGEGKVYVNELNTIPGSLSFYLFEPLGISFSALTDKLIQLALQRFRRSQRTVYTYDSAILEQGGFKGKK